MLVFVIPLKSKTVSNSWDKVNQLLERTVRSVCSQTSNEFKVIVVHHEKPNIEFEHKNLSYLEAPFPPPEPIENPKEDRKRKHTDNKRKLWLGLKFSESFKPSHVMFVDADDCVSCHLAHYVKEHNNENGWYVDKGFEYPAEGSIIYPRSNLYEKCGTSNIIKYELLKPLLEVDVYEIDGLAYLPHKKIPELFKEMGYPFSALPFPGSIYITGHGDNIFLEYFSKKNKNPADLTRFYLGKLKKLLVGRPLTKKIRDEFSL
ncbi:MAG: hypothetical protein KME20_16930 [Kaiparowitsia implicata GSE-PSE-MK54-09C]|jgi:hypothetical protein|nr:hypothetical protein [Kaiparowitsia implicata GSE-PSE-MK54-09C]